MSEVGRCEGAIEAESVGGVDGRVQAEDSVEAGLEAVAWKEEEGGGRKAEGEAEDGSGELEHSWRFRTFSTPSRLLRLRAVLRRSISTCKQGVPFLPLRGSVLSLEPDAPFSLKVATIVICWLVLDQGPPTMHVEVIIEGP